MIPRRSRPAPVAPAGGRARRGLLRAPGPRRVAGATGAVALAALAAVGPVGAAGDPAFDPFEALGLVRFDSGVRAPAFKLVDLGDREVRIPPPGASATILVFWATW